jgi:hypothetical protein
MQVQPLSTDERDASRCDCVASGNSPLISVLCHTAKLKRSSRILEITGRANVAAAWSSHDPLANIVYKERQKPSSERPVGHLSLTELQAEIGCGAEAAALLITRRCCFVDWLLGFVSTLLWQVEGHGPTCSHQGRVV